MSLSGLKAFRRIQIGAEATPGLAVAATARLVGKLGLKPENKDYRPDDMETGKLSSYERSYVIGEQASGAYESDANYDQLGYLLGMALRGGYSFGGASLYRNFIPISNRNDRYYSIEYGDDVKL
jgi:hypothetical protein